MTAPPAPEPRADAWVSSVHIAIDPSGRRVVLLLGREPMTDRASVPIEQVLAAPALAAEVEALRAERDELEREIHGLRGEVSIAYGVIDALPEGALDAVPDAKLLAAVRVMDARDKAEMATTAMDRDREAFRARIAALAGALEVIAEHKGKALIGDGRYDEGANAAFEQLADIAAQALRDHGGKP